jgi:hypothetical protein
MCPQGFVFTPGLFDMSKPSDLPLYLAVYKLLLYLYVMVNNFPKSYKYSLGSDILNLGWETLDNVISANSLPNNKKPDTIRMASVSFDKLKIRLRLAHEIRLIDHKKFAFLIEGNEEIGKMLSGWLSWSEAA